MISVSLAKLGSDIIDLTMDEGSTLQSALRQAGFNLDEVLSTKRNGTLISLDTVLQDQDMVMVSVEKVKAGNEEEKVLRLSLKIVDLNRESPKPKAFLNTTSTFQVAKSILNAEGVSMNYFKNITDEAGNVVSLDSQLQEGKQYSINIDRAQELSNSGAFDGDDSEDDESDYDDQDEE